MKKQDIKYWLMGTACLGLLSTMTGCKEDDYPDKGIPTRTRVRFRISLSDNPADSAARKRCKYLVPNNPRFDEKLYPEFTADKMHEPDYEFGTNTREESYCDLFWNKVY